MGAGHHHVPIGHVPIGHAHGRGHARRSGGGAPDDAVVSRGWRRFVVVVAVLVGVATAAGMVVLWPGEDLGRGAARRLGLTGEVYRAEVQRVTTVPCEGTQPSDRVPCIRVRYRLLAGPDRGRVQTTEFGESVTTPDLSPGDRIVLSYLPDAAPRFQYQYADRDRRVPLLALGALFALAVVLLGRWRGLLALVGLGVSLVVLVEFVLPALLEGHDPLLVAVVGASAIAYLALYLAHGFRTMTTVALLGTLGALALTVGLAELFTELTRLSGFADEQAILVAVGRSGLDVQGLVLAGMVLGALGALDDMTVTQASAVWELRRADATARRRDLSRAALRIGRDHVASTVNTLALAYAGASLPLLLLFVLSGRPIDVVANSEVVAVEIVRTLVGSIGLVAAVPITTFLAIQFVPARHAEPDVAARRAEPVVTGPAALEAGPGPAALEAGPWPDVEEFDAGPADRDDRAETSGDRLAPASTRDTGAFERFVAPSSDVAPAAAVPVEDQFWGGRRSGRRGRQGRRGR